MPENRIYTSREMREEQIYTYDFQFMDEPCTVTGTLVLKAESHKPGVLRVFFQLDDGRKIISPVFWWQRYLGLYEMEIGTQLMLNYEPGNHGGVYLVAVEEI